MHRLPAHAHEASTTIVRSSLPTAYATRQISLALDAAPDRQRAWFGRHGRLVVVSEDTAGEVALRRGPDCSTEGAGVSLKVWQAAD